MHWIFVNLYSTGMQRYQEANHLTDLGKTFNTLLVDIHKTRSSTAAASGNITRCALSASGVAAMQPLLSKLSYGWYFTLVGCLSLAGGCTAIFAIKKWGTQWRRQRERPPLTDSLNL